MTTAAPAGERIRLTRRTLWAIPFAAAVGLGVAAAQQAATADEAAWYVLWVPLALVVAAGCFVAARQFRGVLVTVLPIALYAGLDDGSDDRLGPWYLLAFVATILLVRRAARRYRF